MNPAPLPQPAPFTCPNCGASLESKPDFCPRCGARLDEKLRRSPLSFGAAFLLALGLLFFGAIGACGGSLVWASFWPQGNGPILARDFLPISLPFLIVGLIGFIACLLPFFRRKR